MKKKSMQQIFVAKWLDDGIMLDLRGLDGIVVFVKSDNEKDKGNTSFLPQASYDGNLPSDQAEFHPIRTLGNVYCNSDPLTLRRSDETIIFPEYLFLEGPNNGGLGKGKSHGKVSIQTYSAQTPLKDADKQPKHVGISLNQAYDKGLEVSLGVDPNLKIGDDSYASTKLTPLTQTKDRPFEINSGWAGESGNITIHTGNATGTGGNVLLQGGAGGKAKWEKKEEVKIADPQVYENKPPAKGDLMVDKDDGKYKVWTGDKWEEVGAGESKPTKPTRAVIRDTKADGFFDLERFDEVVISGSQFQISDWNDLDRLMGKQSVEIVGCKFEYVETEDEEEEATYTPEALALAEEIKALMLKQADSMGQDALISGTWKTSKEASFKMSARGKRIFWSIVGLILLIAAATAGYLIYTN